MNEDERELRRLVNGYQVTQAIHSIVELGIPDLLADGPRSAADLAQAANANEDALYRVLRALAAINVLEELDGRRFALSDMGQLLRNDVPQSLQACRSGDACDRTRSQTAAVGNPRHLFA